ncbi:MAG: ABC transporter ATP-binding protein [Candidatus Latescibacterota bacterium]|nr:MAG: ABC transporter ATP-binding protein [Candidatus Latescibacterota bacterium]
MNVLELDKVSKSFAKGLLGRKHRVLGGLSLQIERGEVFGLLGHNGAGKTTTMRVILGLLRPDGGEVTLFGDRGATRRALSRIGYLGDETGLYPHLNGGEMLQFAGELFRLAPHVIRSRRNSLLKAVGLAEKREVKISKYSKGMRQRLGIAIALMNDPELLILDEPYSSLDPVGRRQLRKLLLSLKQKGKTILLSSHIVPDVEAVCDRVGILSGGTIQKCLSLKEIYAQKTTPVEVTVSGIDPRPLADPVRGVSLVFQNPGAFVLRCEGRGLMKQLVSSVYERGGDVLEIKPLKFSLEDYLLETLTAASADGADTLATEIEELIHAHSS